MNFPGAICSQLKFLQKAKYPKEAKQVNDVDNAGDLRQAAPFSRRGIEHQRLPVVLPQNRRHGPAQNRKNHHADAKPDDHVIEGLLVECGVHFLKHDKRKIEIGRASAPAVFYKSNFFRAVDALEEHGSNFPKVARLSVFLLESFDV